MEDEIVELKFIYVWSKWAYIGVFKCEVSVYRRLSFQRTEVSAYRRQQ